MEIQLGDKIRDKVTGFEGIAVCHSRWLSGCDRWTIQAPAKDGKIPDLASFDVDCLEVTKRAAVKTTPKETGGPRHTPSRI